MESTGALSADDIFREACLVMMQKCKDVREALHTMGLSPSVDKMIE